MHNPASGIFVLSACPLGLSLRRWGATLCRQLDLITPWLDLETPTCACAYASHPVLSGRPWRPLEQDPSAPHTRITREQVQGRALPWFVLRQSATTLKPPASGPTSDSIRLPCSPLIHPGCPAFSLRHSNVEAMGHDSLLHDVI